MTFARELLGLLLPVECAGCGLDDVAWCSSCAHRLAGPAVAVRGPCAAARPDGRSWAAAGVDARGLHGGRAPSDHRLEGPRAARPRRARSRPRSRARPTCWTPASAPRPLVVVACPSTAAARRRRGGNVVDALAAGVVDGLVRGGLAARAAPVLVRSAGSDQVGLGARERARNLAGHVRRAGAARRPAGGPGRAAGGRRADHGGDRRRVPLRARAGRCAARRCRDARLDSRSAACAATATPTRTVHRVIRQRGGWFEGWRGVSVGS